MPNNDYRSGYFTASNDVLEHMIELSRSMIGCDIPGDDHAAYHLGAENAMLALADRIIDAMVTVMFADQADAS